MTDYTRPAALAGSIRSILVDALDRAVMSCLAFVTAFFDHSRIKGVDFCLCAISAGWVWAITNNPDVMHRLAYAGLSFLQQQFVVAILAMLAIGHLIGFLRPEAVTWRIIVLFVAGFVWIVIGGFMTWAVTTGGITYLVAGFVAWISTVHLERQR